LEELTLEWLNWLKRKALSTTINELVAMPKPACQGLNQAKKASGMHTAL
jgi:hypothetical protein